MAELRTIAEFDEVIDALGGILAVAKLTGQKHIQAVYNWRRWGRFPAKEERKINGQLQRLNPPVTASLSLFGIDA